MAAKKQQTKVASAGARKPGAAPRPVRGAAQYANPYAVRYNAGMPAGARRPQPTAQPKKQEKPVPVARPADYIQLTPIVQPIPLVPYSSQLQPLAMYDDGFEDEDYE